VCQADPLCVPEIDLGDLPEPLSRLQALSLGKAEHVKEFFQALVEQFGLGNMKGFKGSTIKSKLPKYPTLTVAESDIRSGTIYSGPYEGYSDVELEEVLDEYLVLPQYRDFRRYPSIDGVYGANLFSQRLLHYRQVDEQQRLPPGTAKRLLAGVMSRYGGEPTQLTENTVRFRHSEVEDPYIDD
jgi:hypothetical protein